MRKAFYFLFIITSITLFSQTKLELGGQFAMGYTWDSREIYPNNSFGFIRLRPRISGKYGDNVKLRISTELRKGTPELKDATFTYTLNRAFEAGTGRRRKPFGRDEETGLYSMPGLGYSELHEITDDGGHNSRDIGFWISGRLFKRPYRTDYDLGIYNGHGDIARTSEKHFAGRLTFSPFSFIEIMACYSRGLDTLGLTQKDAASIGTFISYDSLIVCLDYTKGQDLFRNRNIEGHQAWAKYTLGKFTPLIHYEYAKKSPAATIRLHTCSGFTINEMLCLKTQLTHFHDENKMQYSQIGIAMFARF